MRCGEIAKKIGRSIVSGFAATLFGRLPPHRNLFLSAIVFFRCVLFVCAELFVPPFSDCEDLYQTLRVVRFRSDRSFFWRARVFDVILFHSVVMRTLYSCFFCENMVKNMLKFIFYIPRVDK